MGAVLPGGGRNSAERLIETLFGWIIGDSEGLAALRLVCLVVILVTIVKNVSLFSTSVSPLMSMLIVCAAVLFAGNVTVPLSAT